MFLNEPAVPYDLEELKQIEALINKVPEYNEKIKQLSKKIAEIAEKSKDAGAFSYSYEIENIIYKAFFIELENRPFQTAPENLMSSLKANIVHNGIVANRNILCEICGENRTIDRCHIIPAKLGGLMEDSNLLYLCPTHHRLLDSFMLTKGEWDAIDWERKSEVSQKYSETIILDKHRIFWDRIENGEYSKIEVYKADDTKEFIKYVIIELIKIFKVKKIINRSNIYKLIEPNLKELSKTIIQILVKLGFVTQVTQEKTKYLTLSSENFEVTDEIVLACWQKI